AAASASRMPRPASAPCWSCRRDRRSSASPSTPTMSFPRTRESPFPAPAKCLAAFCAARYPSTMNPALSPLPPVAHPAFDALLAGLPASVAAPLRAAAPLLGTLLESAPYLLGLAREHADWLAGVLEEDAEAAFAALLADVAAAGRGADETELARVLRMAKGRTALLAAIAETGGAWTTARATEALSDLADAALEAALDLLMRLAAARG